jgi:hypothetical protein
LRNPASLFVTGSTPWKLAWKSPGFLYLTLGAVCGPLNSVRTPETFNKCLGIVI